MHARLLVLLAAGWATAAGADVKIPHFQKLKDMDVCGADTRDCAPTSSTRYAKIDGLRYTGNPAHILGRRYASIYQTSKCVEGMGASSFVKETPKTLVGSIKSSEEQNAKTKLQLDIKALLDAAVDLPDAVKAGLEAEFRQKLNLRQVRNIDLKFYRVDLTQEFMDDALDACLQATPRNQKVATGISVIEVSGRWSTDWANDTFTAYETSVGFMNLGTQGKSDYQKLKDRILNGTVPPAAYVIRVAFRPGLAG